jgi:hypothetical protein
LFHKTVIGGAEMAKDTSKKTYDFAGKDPNAVLTEDEIANFDEGMRLKNESRPANQVNFKKAARSVASDLDRLLE